MLLPQKRCCKSLILSFWMLDALKCQGETHSARALFQRNEKNQEQKCYCHRKTTANHFFLSAAGCTQISGWNTFCRSTIPKKREKKIKNKNATATNETLWITFSFSFLSAAGRTWLPGWQRSCLTEPLAPHSSVVLASLERRRYHLASASWLLSLPLLPPQRPAEVRKADSESKTQQWKLNSEVIACRSQKSRQ